MRVLYIIRDRSSRKVWKRLHRWAVGFLDGQEGFFEAALHRAADVTRMTWDEVHALPPSRLRSFDHVVINGKSPFPWRSDVDQAMAALRSFERPVSLFIGHAQPEIMAPDALMGRLHSVFKREPFLDRSLYNLASSNADKILPTHLSNPMQTLSWRISRKNRIKPLPEYGWQSDKAHDVFFLGTMQEKREISRAEIWSTVRNSDLDAIGGVLPNGAQLVPDELLSQPQRKSEYRKRLFDSKVNLAIEGIGPFTFRHLELLWAGSFVLSTPSIRPLELRTPLVEGQDYLAFDDLDDMIDKARHYCSHDAARNDVAKNGRMAYERLHDVEAHAREIRDFLNR